MFPWWRVVFAATGVQGGTRNTTKRWQCSRLGRKDVAAMLRNIAEIRALHTFAEKFLSVPLGMRAQSVAH